MNSLFIDAINVPYGKIYGEESVGKLWNVSNRSNLEKLARNSLVQPKQLFLQVNLWLFPYIFYCI